MSSIYDQQQASMSTNESAQFSNERPSDVEMVRGDTDFADQLALKSAVLDHSRYGNMMVVVETNRILITLGPDYICFLLTFIAFAVGDCFLVAFVNAAFDHLWVKIANVVLLVVQLVSYLLIAVSNPGIALEENMPSQETMVNQDESRKRFCLKCKLRMYRGMHHCKRCDVCIRDYDHHCPWVSKCVGGSNLKRFYFFVTITPLYIMYFIIMLMVSLALNAETTK